MQQEPEYESCPHCPDQGWLVDNDPWSGEAVQVQCEFCYTNENSVFNNSQSTIGQLT